MIYSDLIKIAIHELNIPKYQFAEEMGISVTTLYRILKNEAVLPSNSVLQKLEERGIDTSELDYNEIYYEYVSKRYSDFQWIADINYDSVKLRCRKCNTIYKFSLEEIASQNDVCCPNCRERKSSKPEPYFIYDDHGNKLFKIFENRLIQFFKSTKYNTITIPDGITEIGQKVFWEYSNLREVKLPNTLETICENAFCWCDGMRTLTIPEGTKEIQANAFSHCINLKNVYIPATLEKLDSTAFGFGYSSLRKASVEIHPDNKRYKIENNCLLDIFTNTVLGCVDMEYTTSISVPEGVKHIAEGFASWQFNLKNILFPNSLETIGEVAFNRCTNLESIHIPSICREIQKYAFAGCSGIESVTVSDENICFTSIDNCLIDKRAKKLIHGFRLSKIPADGTVESIRTSAFDGIAMETPLFIPRTISNVEERAFEGEFDIVCDFPEKNDGWNEDWCKYHVGEIKWQPTLISPNPA